MTLVDTTVWIDFFRGRNTIGVRVLEQLIGDGEDVCICGVILTEVLQGIRSDVEHERTRKAFEAFLYLPMTQDTFVQAARIYRSARSRGSMIRKGVDCMIAAAAIEHDAFLLHNDRDFDAIAALGALKIATIA